MTTPGPPQIRVRPRATDQTLEFWWSPPVNDGGSPIQSYILNGPTSNDISSNATYFKLTGLANKTDYAFTLQASNTNGIGTAAPFRTVQPGLLPPAPNFLSIYRQSDTNAFLSWNNPATDANTPDPWRNVLLAPATDSNGRTAYPGDNSVTSTCTRLFGTQTRGDITVATDISHNFIVRGQNDPGYSPAYNGTGVFSLGNSNYTNDVIYAESAAGTFKNRTNFIVKKQTIGPYQNLNNDSNIYNAELSFTTHQRGAIIIDSNTVSNLATVYFVNKNGFLLQKTPELLWASESGSSRTNPVIPIVSQTAIGGVSSNLPVYAFDATDNSFQSTIIQISGTTLQYGGTSYNNQRDTNAFFALNDNTSNNLYLYTIPAASKTPVLRHTCKGFTSVNNQIDKELFVFAQNASIFTDILYIPNTGSVVKYDISGLGITTLITKIPLSPGKVFSYGTNGTNYYAYTFHLTVTPSNEVRQLSGSGLASALTSNSFSNFYNGFTKSVVSFVDTSGGIFYAIPPNSSKPAQAFNGSAHAIAGGAFHATTTFSGYTYSNDLSNYYFTGVGYPDGTTSTFQLKVGSDIISAPNGFAAPDTVNYPLYSLNLFYRFGPNYGNLCQFKYNSNTSTFDVSASIVSGSYSFVDSQRSFNSNINFLTPTALYGSPVSYMISDTIFPPSTLTTYNANGTYFDKWYSTYPSGNYTLGIVANTDVYHIYNGAAFDSSGNIGFLPVAQFTQKGPDCWYFMNDNSATSISLTRISTNGTKVTQNFPIPNDTTNYSAKVMPTGILIKLYNTAIQKRILIDYDITRGTFSYKVCEVNEFDNLYSTYLPTILP